MWQVGLPDWGGLGSPGFSAFPVAHHEGRFSDLGRPESEDRRCAPPSPRAAGVPVRSGYDGTIELHQRRDRHGARRGVVHSLVHGGDLPRVESLRRLVRGRWSAVCLWRGGGSSCLRLSSLPLWNPADGGLVGWLAGPGRRSFRVQVHLSSGQTQCGMWHARCPSDLAGGVPSVGAYAREERPVVSRSLCTSWRTWSSDAIVPDCGDPCTLDGWGNSWLDRGHRAEDRCCRCELSCRQSTPDVRVPPVQGREDCGEGGDRPPIPWPGHREGGNDPASSCRNSWGRGRAVQVGAGARSRWAEGFFGSDRGLLHEGRHVADFSGPGSLLDGSECTAALCAKALARAEEGWAARWCSCDTTVLCWADSCRDERATESKRSSCSAPIHCDDHSSHGRARSAYVLWTGRRGSDHRCLIPVITFAFYDLIAQEGACVVRFGTETVDRRHERSEEMSSWFVRVLGSIALTHFSFPLWAESFDRVCMSWGLTWSRAPNSRTCASCCGPGSCQTCSVAGARSAVSESATGPALAVQARCMGPTWL